MKIHPVAELFPMMSEEELSDLAEDIKANGLINPIVVDADGVLIDGRNRLKACQIAKVKPTTTELNGADPVAFIISANEHRRHMNRGQRALIAAKIRCLSIEYSQRKAAHAAGISQGSVKQADIVLEYALDLVDAVIAGNMFLSEAYKQATERKQKTKSIESRLENLRKEAPDLANQVDEETLTLDEAQAAWHQRTVDIAKAKESGRAAARDFTFYQGAAASIIGAIKLGEPIDLNEIISIADKVKGFLNEEHKKLKGHQK